MESVLPRKAVPDQEFAARLLAARLAAGLTQRRMAEALGFSSQQWAKVERGKCHLVADLLPVVCRLVRCSADELLGIEDFIPRRGLPAAA